MITIIDGKEVNFTHYLRDDGRKVHEYFFPNIFSEKEVYDNVNYLHIHCYHVKKVEMDTCADGTTVRFIFRRKRQKRHA